MSLTKYAFKIVNVRQIYIAMEKKSYIQYLCICFNNVANHQKWFIFIDASSFLGYAVASHSSKEGLDEKYTWREILPRLLIQQKCIIKKKKTKKKK